MVDGDEGKGWDGRGRGMSQKHSSQFLFLTVSSSLNYNQLGRHVFLEELSTVHTKKSVLSFIAHRQEKKIQILFSWIPRGCFKGQNQNVFS